MNYTDRLDALLALAECAPEADARTRAFDELLRMARLADAYEQLLRDRVPGVRDPLAPVTISQPDA